jgi:hypothetical protein
MAPRAHDHESSRPDVDDEAPTADVLEQRQSVDDTAPEAPAPSAVLDDRPEADVQEQAEGVEDYQRVVRGTKSEDADEADWLEQTIEEPLEDDHD